MKKSDWDKGGESFNYLINFCLNNSFRLKKEILFNYKILHSIHRVLDSDIMIGESQYIEDHCQDISQGNYGIFHTHPFWLGNYNEISEITNFIDLYTAYRSGTKETIVGISLHRLAIINISRISNSFWMNNVDNLQECKDLILFRENINNLSSEMKMKLISIYGDVKNFKVYWNYFISKQKSMIKDLIQKKIILFEAI